MGETETRLLNNLDKPVTIAGIDLMELILFLSGFGIGILRGVLIMGFLCGISAALILRRIKKLNEGTSLAALVYWYLPEKLLPLKVKVPSHVREWVA